MNGLFLIAAAHTRCAEIVDALLLRHA